MAKTTSLTLNRPVGQLDVKDLKSLIREIFEELIRDIVRQEQRPSYYLDEAGHKIFFNEYAYSRFVESHPDKLPSELNASFIDAQGFRCHYSDYELKPSVKIDWLAENADRLDHEKMKGHAEMSLHFSGYRILYLLDRPKQTIIIRFIDKHDKAYQKLRRS